MNVSLTEIFENASKKLLAKCLSVCQSLSETAYLATTLTEYPEDSIIDHLFPENHFLMQTYDWIDEYQTFDNIKSTGLNNDEFDDIEIDYNSKECDFDLNTDLDFDNCDFDLNPNENNNEKNEIMLSANGEKVIRDQSSGSNDEDQQQKKSQIENHISGSFKHEKKPYLILKTKPQSFSLRSDMKQFDLSSSASSESLSDFNEDDINQIENTDGSNFDEYSSTSHDLCSSLVEHFQEYFSEKEVRNIFQTEAKGSYGVAERLLRERQFFVSQFPTVTPEEVKEALIQAKNDSYEALRIIEKKRIEEPIPEEALMALRPEISFQTAQKIVSAIPKQEKEKTINPWKALQLAKEFISVQKHFPKKEQNRSKIFTLDLHGMTLDDATKYVVEVLENNRNSSLRKIHFITGKGKHSVKKRPVIRPMVLKEAERLGFKANLLSYNEGVVVVDLMNSQSH